MRESEIIGTVILVVIAFLSGLLTGGTIASEMGSGWEVETIDGDTYRGTVDVDGSRVDITSEGHKHGIQVQHVRRIERRPEEPND